jgi:hypothetical protein
MGRDTSEVNVGQWAPTSPATGQANRAGDNWAKLCGCRGHYHTINYHEITDKWCAEHSPLKGMGTELKASTTNPKDLVGVKKVSVTKLPAVAMIHAAHALMHGAKLYGPYNWRAKKVQAEIYIDAALRHITSWNEREEVAADSGVHHLGHAIACLAILLDAQETGNLVDNRPESDGTYQKVLARLNKTITEATNESK